MTQVSPPPTRVISKPFVANQTSFVSRLEAISRLELDREAKKLRSAFAADYAKEFLNQYDPGVASIQVAQSIFGPHAQDYPSDDPIRTLAFNLSVTELLVRQLWADYRGDDRTPFLTARLIELCGYSLFEPFNTERGPKTFLAASKRRGYFFTPPLVAGLIVQRALGGREAVSHLLDPAAGAGSLLAAVCFAAAEERVAIKHITAIEIDHFTGRLLQTALERLVTVHNLNAELSVLRRDAIAHLHQEYKSGQRNYDCIVMNPPYGRIKFLKNSLINGETRTSERERTRDQQAEHWQHLVKSQAAECKRISGNLGLGEGAQDYQRLFAGLAMNVLRADGRLSWIAPSSWLGDRESVLLRRQILDSKSLESVLVVPEDAGLFATVNQPTAIATVAPSPSRSSFLVQIATSNNLNDTDEHETEYKTMAELDARQMRIPRVPHKMHEIYEKLQEFPRIQDIADLRNARGELDQTLGKHVASDMPTAMRLVRGDHIERYVLRPPESSGRSSYVSVPRLREYIGNGPKSSDIRKPRIASRQCSYMKKARRLSFALVPPQTVLGNSCNYICSKSGNIINEEYLYALCVVLNSAVMEWYFRIFNSNNHVANYEIDDFPCPLQDADTITSLAVVGRHFHDLYQHNNNAGKTPAASEDVAEALVAEAFGLSESQTRLILERICPERADYISYLVTLLRQNNRVKCSIGGVGRQQHVASRLSALDHRVIEHIPQGGNWQDIPEDVPSKRLEQIRAMSKERGVVRTTYYGRLRPDQPAYTIATYYNRPGNGTNIHPWENRTLSNREAARLQSFPDSYWFIGTDGSVRKQIGNAVPPLLAYAIGTEVGRGEAGLQCVDLFAGAGGMSLGLEMAGWTVAAAVEYDKGIGATYKFNRPCETVSKPGSTRTLFLDEDLSTESARSRTINAIKSKLGAKPLFALVGGPPCQGFSHAGWRLDDDARNDLAVGFMEFAQALQPEIVILENVEGLLSYKQGQVVRDLLAAIQDLGYDIDGSPWLLRAEQYGVPQMRRRVFLIGCRSCRKIVPPIPFLSQCRGRREVADTENLFGSQPYPVTVAEALVDLPALVEKKSNACGSRIVRSYYSAWARGLMSVQDLRAHLSSG
ncbi:DNA (cytosine-5-)-methyltransferase [Phycisphaerales bacterium AB-hyl4]|uniref:DNA (cytosine-5-)-methyltransferase n=1 Tax=Natronomicrosphaera hydrolytica TaxID=3242702 RepID=A0ABV4U292_9BACT